MAAADRDAWGRAVTAGAALLPATLRHDIEKAIADSAPAWDVFVNANRESGGGGHPLAVKYVPSRYASTYLGPNSGLFIGSSNFTWGRGIYVTGVEAPLSTAIYGRVGVVSWFDPVNWKAFDARDHANVELYLRWLHAQPDYPEAILTVHLDHWLHQSEIPSVSSSMSTWSSLTWTRPTLAGGTPIRRIPGWR